MKGCTWYGRECHKVVGIILAILARQMECIILSYFTKLQGSRCNKLNA
jgi:hypothetical protein